MLYIIATHGRAYLPNLWAVGPKQAEEYWASSPAALQPAWLMISLWADPPVGQLSASRKKPSYLLPTGRKQLCPPSE